LVREARAHLIQAGNEQDTWLDRLEEQHQDLHDLVNRFLESDQSVALELAATLWRFWWLRDHMAEGRSFVERASRIDGPDRIEALKGLGTIAFRQGDLSAADRAFNERLGLLEATDRKRDIADAFADMARLALRRGDFAAVRSFAEKGYKAASGLDATAIRMLVHLRAAAARMEGRYVEARALYLESRELSAQLGNEMNVAGEDHNLFYVALHTGDRAEAERWFLGFRDWSFAHDDAYQRPYVFLDAGVLALHDRDFERAGHLVARAQRIFEDAGAVPDPDDKVELDNAVSRLKRELGHGFDHVWAQGTKLTIEEAQALAR
jgi:tetratricopeptide (TPR) repeat protein